MKILFVEAKYNKKISINNNYIKKLPKRICLTTTVQFIDSINNLKKILEDNNKKIIIKKGKHTKYPAQILGCDTPKVSCDAFLYIGDGLFHPIALALKNDKPVFVYNPFSKKFFELNNNIINDYKRKMKGALLKFLSSKEIGVIISTKPGQNNLRRALELKEKYKEKSFYYLIFDSIEFEQLENFPFVECFVNTACPRIAYDDANKFPRAVINLEELRF